MKGLRIGVLRHVYEEDLPAVPALKAALEQAYDVLRGLGATIEDARIRPLSDYHAVKITGAESELFSSALSRPSAHTAERFRGGFPGPGAGGVADQRAGLHAGVAAAAGDDRRDGPASMSAMTCW